MISKECIISEDIRRREYTEKWNAIFGDKLQRVYNNI